MTVSTTTRTPQEWHGDGGHIFDHAHQPPHCINVFVPLDDLTDTNGPTEFIPGTHVLNVFDNDRQGGSGNTDGNSNSFAIKAKAGGVIMFDYRLKHRGGLNSTPNDRLLLCLCYARPWFQDQANPVGNHATLITSRLMCLQPPTSSSCNFVFVRFDWSTYVALASSSNGPCSLCTSQPQPCKTLDATAAPPGGRRSDVRQAALRPE